MRSVTSFEAEAANLFFQLVSSRYERASLIITSNKVFGFDTIMPSALAAAPSAGGCITPAS